MEPENTPSPYAGLAAKIRDGKSASTKEIESRLPELIISRGFDGSAGHGVAGKLIMAHRNLTAASTFRVLVDGVVVGELAQEEKLLVRLNPGVRRIRVNSSMAKSNEFTRTFTNGDRVTLNCRTKLSGIVLYE